MLVTCENCDTKICCYQPVELTMKDIERFRENNIKPELELVTMGNNMYYMHLRFKDKMKCQFLSDSGECAIYDARPEACRGFECKALGKDKEEIDQLYDTGLIPEYVSWFLNSAKKSDMDPSSIIVDLSSVADFEYIITSTIGFIKRLEAVPNNLVLGLGGTMDMIKEYIEKNR